MEGLGLDCRLDEWSVVNYSRNVDLRNVICTLAGEDPRQIVLMAHIDHAPTTVQGADNDGSGIAVLLHLAEVFTVEGTPRHTLAFVGTDAEEYGMLGSRRFVATHPDPKTIIAGISLDNLGKRAYDGMKIEAIGQFRNYMPIWLILTARSATSAVPGLWVPSLRSPMDQALDQAAPVSFMDQGPFVAAGIPAIGFAGRCRPEEAEWCWATFHTELDTIETQSAEALEQSGRVGEALVRQLQGMADYPVQAGPYLYFDESGTSLRGAPLWAVFIAFVAVFFLVAWLRARRSSQGLGEQWRSALPHFLGYWIALTAAIAFLYLLVAVGWLDAYAAYPATQKDPAFFQPHWPAIAAFLGFLALALAIGRGLARTETAPAATSVQSLGFLAIGLAATYIVAINPFSLLFVVPVLAWFAIRGRPGPARVLDIALLLSGGLVVYALFYFFGFVTLRINWYMAWYLLMMFSIGMVSFPTAAAIMAIVGAGLSMVTAPPRRATRA
jgi:hypothetical protein